MLPKRLRLWRLAGGLHQREEKKNNRVGLCGNDMLFF